MRTLPEFVCPHCRGSLEQSAADLLHCRRDGFDFTNAGGIWRFLPPDRERHYRDFMAEYETIRRLEGRGSSQATYYRALPFKDLNGGFAADWAIRARSFQSLDERVLAKLREQLQRPLKLLDLGAGNCWLSNRLAARGDLVTAVDLLVNETDGLGAWRHYQHAFVPVQAEFMRLPIIDHSIDIAIFNASFHYAENYAATLREALRVLGSHGSIVIMDSPIYHQGESGEKMVAEREADFMERYGFASNSLESKNFLTYRQVHELGNSLGIRWRYIRPFYGLRWFLRPIIAGLRGRREPAKFHILVAERYLN